MKTNPILIIVTPAVKTAALAAVCALVFAGLSSCSVARSLTYWYPDIDDHKIFHHVELIPPAEKFTFHEGTPETRQKIADWTVAHNHWFDADTLDMPLGQYLATRGGTTAMLGLVVQRAVGRNMTKSDSGFNATARDLAKIGRLYLHGGEWNGVRIVDPAKNLIMVRLGESGDKEYETLFYDLSKIL